MRTSLNNFRNDASNTLLSKDQQRHIRGGLPREKGGEFQQIVCFYIISDSGGNTTYASGDGACAGTHDECMGYAGAAAQDMISLLGGGHASWGCNHG
jgi:hypothetical protein